MKIAFLILDASIGGHTRSAISIANALRKKGNEVWLILPENYKSLSTSIDINDSSKKFTFWVQKRYLFLNDIKVMKTICIFLNKKNIKIIHTFDLHSHILGYFIHRKIKIPILSTICGGIIKHHFPFTRPVIVFSKELKYNMINKFGFKPKDIIVEPARMTIEKYNHNMSDKKISKNNDVNLLTKKIIMIARLSSTKIKSILYTLEIIDKLAEKKQDFIYIHIGSAQEKYVKEKVYKKIKDMNKRHLRVVAILNEHLSLNASYYLKEADIVIGVGRVCFEGMIFKKPVLVVGEYGYAGSISPMSNKEELRKIAFYNFSGRNISKDNLESNSKEMLLLLDRFLSDKNFAEKCGEFGNRWIRRYDVKHAAKTYNNLYNSLINYKNQECDPIITALSGYIILFGEKMKKLFKGSILRMIMKT